MPDEGQDHNHFGLGSGTNSLDDDEMFSIIERTVAKTGESPEKVAARFVDDRFDLDNDAPCLLKPEDLPDQRLNLMAKWDPRGGVFTRLVELVGSIGTESYTDYDKLQGAELYWVSADTCATVWSAYDSYPNDTVLDETFPPAECGFAVFAEPFIGHDAKTEQPIRVDAICWGPVHLRSRNSDAHGRGVSITSYRWMPEVASLVVLGRADWLYGVAIVDQCFADDPIPEAGLASVIEDRKVFSTLCSLVQNPRVVENERSPLPRAARRRSERAGIDPDRVRVHTLRIRGEGDEVAPTGETRTYRHRWVVRPHWRQQAHGPGRSLRRPVLIPPHVRGPKGAPLLNPKNKVTRL
jgi:hypothetical protein